MSLFRWLLLAGCSCSLASLHADDVKINAAGKIIVHGDLTLDSGKVTVAQDGALDLQSGTVKATEVEVQLGGTLSGIGTIDGKLTSSGTVALDVPLGALAVTGDVVFTSTSSLKLGLGGLTTGTFSFIDAGGTVTVGGNLAFTFLNGLEATMLPTDSLTLITGNGPIVGAFSNVLNMGTLVSTDGLGSVKVQYSTSDLIVNSFTPPPATNTLIYVTGDAVSGEQVATTYNTFGVPSVDPLGNLVFGAQLRTAPGAAGLKSAILTGTPDSVAVRQGDTAPGTTLSFASFEDPMTNAMGALTFGASLSGTGVTAANKYGLWSNAGGALALVARNGATAPGLGVAKFKVIQSAGFSDTGAVPFQAQLAGTGVTTATDLSLWLWTPAATTLLLREGTDITFAGETTPRKPASWVTLSEVDGSPGQGRSSQGDALVARIAFKDGVSAIAEVSPTVHRLIAKEGAVVPVAPAGAKYAEFGIPTYNSNGDIAFGARLATGAGGVTSANCNVILADTANADTDLIVRSGAVAVGAEPAIFRTFSDPVYNQERDVAFIGNLNFNGPGIWWKHDGQLKLVARFGQHPPGTASAVQFQSFESIALPDGGWPIFVAKLRTSVGGVNATNNTGIWAADRLGNLMLLARLGDTVLVHNTPPARKITGLTFLGAVDGSPDHARGYNPAKQFTYKVTFADKTEAIFLAEIP